MRGQGEEDAAKVWQRVSPPHRPALFWRERIMKKRTLILVGLFVLLGGYAASGAIRATAPGRPEVKITPPPADLAPELAAFSGIWEDGRDGVLPARLIVEKIQANWATIVYTWADDPTGNFKAGWARVRAKVLPDGTLRWGYPGKFTVKLVNGGTNIEGKKEQAGSLSTFALKKVGLAAAQ
jgi:hypothetical protein